MGLFSQQIAQRLFNVGDIYLIQVHRMGALLTSDLIPRHLQKLNTVP